MLKDYSILGRRGVSEGTKSDFARNKIKSIGKQYLDELVDFTTDSLSKKIAGKGVDIHKAIGKLPKPKSGWTLPGHKYTGGRRGDLMVSALDAGANGPGSSPGRGHCVVFLGKTLYSHGASLHPGV